MGRPSKYSPQIIDKICEMIETSSRGLHAICRDDESLPHPATVIRWLSEYHEFRDRYARAREIQADLIADEIIEIADDSSGDTLIDEKGRIRADHEFVNRSRLRVDARKWKASKLAPKKYGDKLDVTTQGESLKEDFSQLTYEQLYRLKYGKDPDRKG